jgi:hypothetical protein
LKPTQANSSVRPYLENASQKRAGKVAQGVGPEFKSQYCKKKKKKSRMSTRGGWEGGTNITRWAQLALMCEI